MPAGPIINETDRSFVAALRPGGRMGMMILASKGPLRTPTKLDSPEDLIRKFGPQLSTDDSWWHAKRALDRGAKLLVSRSAHYSDAADATTSAAVEAEISVNDRGTATASNPYMISGEGPWNVLSSLTNNLIFDKNGTPATTLTLAAARASITSVNAQSAYGDFRW